MAGLTDVIQFGEGKAVSHVLVVRASISDPAGEGPHSVVHFTDGSTLRIYSSQYDYYEAKK